MKIIFLVSFFICLGFSAAFSQNALIMLKFEDAEKAFNNGDYKEALQHLDEVENTAGITSKTLYLRIVIENQLFNNGAGLYEDERRFDQLQHIRENAKKYLNALSKQGIDDKYRKVYRISEDLDAFPKNKQEWIKGRSAYHKQIEEEKQKQEEAKRLAVQNLKDREYNQLYNGLLSIKQAKLHQVARVSTDSADRMSTLYIIRPKEGTKNMVQSLLLNERMIKKKLRPGEYMKLYCTPGLLKIGETTAENRRKVKPGTALLMGGVIGLAATSGKTIAKSQKPFFLTLEAGKTYYVTSIITKEKTILYQRTDEATAQIYLAALNEVD